jgi:hypothetical protein
MQLPVSYPRVSGVLVPSSLRQAGYRIDGLASPEGRAQTAGDVVAWVRRTQRRLPAALLDSALPPPDIILKSWVIGSRTRGSLERILGTPAAAKMQRVRDYVGVKKLGVHGLVDLLAAREEQGAGSLPPRSADHGFALMSTPQVTVAPASRLDVLSASIRGQLPLRPSELPGALAASGFADERLSLDVVVRFYRQAKVPVPFRVVRRGGATVLVAPESLGAAEALLANAAHYVFNWGVCTVRTLLERLQALQGVSIETRDATRILTAIPRFRWLDETAGWFSFAEYGTRLSVAVRKVFAIAERVRLEDLSRALTKAVELLATVPRRAIATYLSEVVGCEIFDGWVRPPATLARAPLERSELALVEVLQQSGGEATMSALRKQASAVGVTVRILRHVTRTSPLMLMSSGSLRLVGVARPRLVPERRRAAAAPVFAPLFRGSATPQVMVPSPVV